MRYLLTICTGRRTARSYETNYRRAITRLRARMLCAARNHPRTEITGRIDDLDTTQPYSESRTYRVAGPASHRVVFLWSRRGCR